MRVNHIRFILRNGEEVSDDLIHGGDTGTT